MTAHEMGSPTVTTGEGAEPTAVGRFTWDTVSDTWWWSDGLYQLYGYQPAAVQPTLQLFLQHKDPRDRAQIDLVFSRCAQEGGPFSCHHRIIDAHGTRKTVVAIGFGHRNPADTSTDLMQGFLVEVGTRGERPEAEEGLQALLRSRALIEQVKGALMLTHGVTPDGAFHLLRGYSQVYNKKVAAIVAAAVEAFHARPPANLVTRSELDQILWDAAQS